MCVIGGFLRACMWSAVRIEEEIKNDVACQMDEYQTDGVINDITGNRAYCLML